MEPSRLDGDSTLSTATGGAGTAGCPAFADQSDGGGDGGYVMDHPERGVALVLSHSACAGHPAPGAGAAAAQDALRLQEAFSDLGFQVRRVDDASKHDVARTLREVAAEDHTNRDCLVVAVLTHCPRNGVLCANDGDYEVSELLDHFTPRNCPSLAVKPKLFFIQAYAGEEMDEDAGVDEPLDTFHAPPCLDMLVWFSIFDGQFWLPGHEGVSPYLQALCEQLASHGRSHDLTALLTGLNRQLWRLLSAAPCVRPLLMPGYSSSLTRSLQLRPKAKEAPPGGEPPPAPPQSAAADVTGEAPWKSVSRASDILVA